MLMTFRDAADAESGGCVAVDERRSEMAFFFLQKVDVPVLPVRRCFRLMPFNVRMDVEYAVSTSGNV